jgi:hemolysin D
MERTALELQVEDQVDAPVAPGMRVNAETITGDQRLIEYVLSPSLRYQHESGRER